MSLPESELERLRGLAPVPGAWLVGGSVRDLLRGSHVTDIDLVVDGDAGAAARELARGLGGSPFPLSERHGAWRVAGSPATVDIAAARGAIDADLTLRDFTVNAMALPLDGGALIDPTGGREDLDAGLLRAVSPAVFEDDPLRLLRLARLARELEFDIDPATEQLALRWAPLAAQPAGERIYMELRRLLALDDPVTGMELLQRLGVLAAVLPELGETRGVEQSRFHHLDVFEHTLQVLDATADIADHPEHYLPARAAAIAAELGRGVGDDLTERVALRFAALFHDIRKPQTRSVTAEGRVSFMGHDREGADTAAAVLRRWNASTAMIRFCEVMVREHLRLGFLGKERPISRRTGYRYLRATEPYPLASIVLSLADRLATRGPRARQRYHRVHAETADEVAAVVMELMEHPQDPLLRGDDIARLTGAAGPRIGELVSALAEEQAAGAVVTRDQAVAFVNR